MAHENPPWELPAVGCARGSGSPGGRIGKPLETMGRKARGCRAQFAQCSFGCIRQTGGNVGTAKPEATALKKFPRRSGEAGLAGKRRNKEIKYGFRRQAETEHNGVCSGGRYARSAVGYFASEFLQRKDKI